MGLLDIFKASKIKKKHDEDPYHYFEYKNHSNNHPTKNIITPADKTYAKAVFLNAYKKGSHILPNNKYFRYLNTECKIDNPSDYHKQLIDDGYFMFSKEDNKFILTDKALEYLEKHKDCVLIHKYHSKWNIDWNTYHRIKNTFSFNPSFYDVMWNIFNERQIAANNFDCLTYRHMYELLCTEKKFDKALQMLLSALFLELNCDDQLDIIFEHLSGKFNSYIDILDYYANKEYLCYIDFYSGKFYSKQLIKLKEYYSDDVARKVASSLSHFPIKICDTGYFIQVINNLINNDYDEVEINSYLKKNWNKFIKTI